MTEASVPGKIILCGEHAVVYARPAIALPLSDVRARAVVQDTATGDVAFHAPDLDQRWSLRGQPDHVFSELVARTLTRLGITPTPALQISISSTIPLASGMGSGAAIATAIVRALAAHLGHELAPEAISALVYASEQRFHGTPSGIDNTVVAFEQPIWFLRRPAQEQRTKNKEQNLYGGPSVVAIEPGGPSVAAIEPIDIAAPFTLQIGDTGVRSPTHLPVGDVRQRWQASPAHYEALFDAVAALVFRARAALSQGDIPTLGALLDENQALLVQIGVSSPDLDRLVAAARAAGALGAKLSGGGWGGVMIALVDPAARERVAAALRAAGAVAVLETSVARYAAPVS
jgi:mevalonate kinase